MKNFTAIYDAKKYQNIEYAFKAIDINHANDFAKTKFYHANIFNFRIIEK